MVQGKFVWSDEADMEIYDRSLPKRIFRSTPSCYNSEDHLVVRSCREGEWSPRQRDLTKCFTYSETTPINTICPEEAKELLVGEDEYICLEVSKTPENYKLQDNVRNRLHTLSLEYLQASGITNIWSSIKIYDNFSLRFNLSNVYLELLSFREILESRNKSCFVENLESGLRTQVSCEREFYSVREYSPKKLSMKSACPENTAANIFQPTVCVGVLPGSPNYNFEDFITSNNWIKNAWSEYFKDYNNLKLDTGNTSFVPPSKNYFVEFPKGIYGGVEIQSRPYLNKFELAEVKISLNLTMNRVTGFLQVSCENCNFFYKFQEHFEVFNCFLTDRSGNPKPVKRIEKLASNKWYIRYDLEEEGYRFYWCQGFSIFHFEIISTQKVQAGWLRNGSEIEQFQFTVGMSDTKTTKIVLESMSTDIFLSDVEILEVTSVDYNIVKLLVSKVIYNTSIEVFRNHILQNYNFVGNFTALKAIHQNLGPLKEILQSIDKNRIDESVKATLETLGSNITSMDLLCLANIFKQLNFETDALERASETVDDIAQVSFDTL